MSPPHLLLQWQTKAKALLAYFHKFFFFAAEELCLNSLIQSLHQVSCYWKNPLSVILAKNLLQNWVIGVHLVAETWGNNYKNYHSH